MIDNTIESCVKAMERARYEERIHVAAMFQKAIESPGTSGREALEVVLAVLEIDPEQLRKLWEGKP